MNETLRLGDAVQWRKRRCRVERLLPGWVEVRDEAGVLWTLDYLGLRKAVA